MEWAIQEAEEECSVSIERDRERKRERERERKEKGRGRERGIERERRRRKKERDGTYRERGRRSEVIESSMLIPGPYWRTRSSWFPGNKRHFGTSRRHWTDWLRRRTRKAGRSSYSVG